MVNKHRKGHLNLANDKPKLPDILFNMICKPEPQAPTETNHMHHMIIIWFDNYVNAYQ